MKMLTSYPAYLIYPILESLKTKGRDKQLQTLSREMNTIAKKVKVNLQEEPEVEYFFDKKLPKDAFDIASNNPAISTNQRNLD
jgi:hypothetical protein